MDFLQILQVLHLSISLIAVFLNAPITIFFNLHKVDGFIASRLFRIRLFPCSPMSYSPIPYSPILCWPILYSPIPCLPIPYSPIPCSPIPCLPELLDVSVFMPIPYSTSFRVCLFRIRLFRVRHWIRIRTLLRIRCIPSFAYCVFAYCVFSLFRSVRLFRIRLLPCSPIPYSPITIIFFFKSAEPVHRRYCLYSV